MRNWILVSIFCLFISQAHATPHDQNQTEKDWTLLVYLNGFNNLDSFGYEDINEMETVGSSSKINVVVQWASLQTGVVKRLKVEKDTNPNQVTSPVLSDLGRIDMGDYRSLIEFVKWAKTNYPAKKYFIDVWNHGSGWHKGMKRELLRNISSDDFSGNSITTAQLGHAMKEISNELGQKVDIYGSDACLMNMVEVAAEMKDSVNIYLGSQDNEPAPGWAYDRLLRKWNALPNASASDVAKIQVREYMASYPGRSNITQSALDMSQYDAFAASIRDLGQQMRLLPQNEKANIMGLAVEATSFYYTDYKDVGHLVKLLETRLPQNSSIKALAPQVGAALSKFVIANDSSSDLSDASGVSFWFPESISTYNRYSSKYQPLVFNADTQWSDALTHVLQ